MLLLLSELLFALRRDGLDISTAQAITCARAAEAVGFDDRTALMQALACTLVTTRRERALFDTTTTRFFSKTAAHANDLWHRLRARGFDDAELETLRAFARAASERTGEGGDGLLVRVLTGGADELEWLLRTSRMKSRRAGMKGTQTVGFFAEDAVLALRRGPAASALGRMTQLFADAFGDARANALQAALADELGAMKRRIRVTFEREVTGNTEAAGALTLPFHGRTEARLAVRRLAEKLEGQARMRERRARRGTVDLGRTQRLAMRTGGVPLQIARSKPRRDRAKAVLVCDLSDSVRHAASFLIEFVIAAQKLLRRTRTFVFVNEARDVTALLRDSSADAARHAIERGDVVPLSATSNYGRAFDDVLLAVGRTLDKRTTLIILGDGRTNYQAEGLEQLASMKHSARELLWLCPEPSSTWGQGDSRMPAYASLADRVLPAMSARDLEDAARALVRTSRA